MNTTDWYGDLWEKSVGLRAIFYLVPPSEAVEKIENVPPYLDYAIPWFYFFVVLDLTVGFLRNKLSFEPRNRARNI